ncbi:MAG: CocE/NonD family hydrolase, partial [Nevskiales bacterium]
PVLDAVDGALDAIADGCHEFGGPDEFCAVLDTLAGLLDGGGAPTGDQELLLAAADDLLRGCDILDTAHCLFPFPNDHFTVAASAGSPQHADNDGTGRRINFNPLAMPRNIVGKPIDPTEWNRNDGYSPGQMIVTYVPGLAANADGTIPGAPTIKDASTSLDIANSPVLVIDAESGEPHPAWAEIDLNAGMLLYVPGREFGGGDTVIPNPKPKQAALIIRPAVNFKEGHRYVVVLKNLPKDGGGTVAAGTAFTACRDDLGSALPPVQARCDQLQDRVFPVLEDADIGVEDNAALYLAWDFTVASTNNVIGRLRHMRDDAFVNYLGQQEDEDGSIENLGRAPAFEITEVNDYPADHGQLVREIKGTFTVPSYVVPVDPSPADGHAELRRRINELPPEIQAQIEGGPLFAPIEMSLPPNRLNYLPDASSPAACDPAQPEASLQGRCLEQARFGDGLPDRSGEMTTTFTCRIAKTTLNNMSFADASEGDVTPARPSLYGHGLLGDHGEINQDQLRRFGNDHNMMFCATDWFGFASGDLPNVLTLTLDLSNFPVLPDGTQQGILNQMFLARLLRHPQGFAAHSAFRVGGKPVFDTREVFYDGNSQGGITGGVVVAASKDIKRGSLGVLGMNYSTLLTRSVDFDIFSVPLYASYPDDLDRSLNFSLMQMLWDRSENNGYAHHLTDNSALQGPDKEVLLHPAFGDHQVTMWSADVMARTVGANVDRTRISSARREPVGFNNPELTLQPLDYTEKDHFEGSGLVYWDEPWPDTEWQDCAGQSTPPPPIGNQPPRAGDDPHECPRRQAAARCQKSHFLHSAGELINVSGVTVPADCPAVPEPIGEPLEGVSGSGSVLLCAPDAMPGIGGECLEVSSIPVIGPVLATLLNGVDGVTETVADACNESPLAPACVITDSLAQIVQQGGGSPPVGGGQNASCALGENLAGGRSYQVMIPSESGESISFQVLEPKTFNCASAGSGAHPLVLHGHGFGGSRSTSGFDSYRNAGYAVISIDQRGFGGSSGTVRVMDPDFEGKDLVRILDWAEENLDYLAWRDEGTGEFVTRPDDGESEAGGENLLAGAIGGSYGGGFQFLLHNVDEKNRLDALAPDITWHDLRYSLNPGDVLKSGWDLLLAAGGEAGSYQPGLQNQNPPTSRGLDPYIKEVLVRGIVTGEFPRDALEWFRYHSPAYWCGLNGQATMPYSVQSWDPVDPNTMLGGLAGNTPGSNTRDGQPPVNVLLTQGMRDTLFNFNDAWWNYQCLSMRAGNDADVRLITHQSGHILQGFVPAPGPFKFQELGGSGNCGTLSRDQTTQAWFDEKLRGAVPALADEGICLSLADGDAISVPADRMLAPRAPDFLPAQTASYYPVMNVGASNVPQGLLAQSLYDATPGPAAVMPLLTVSDANGLLVAGIPQADVTVSTPAGANDAACAAAPSQLPSLRTGCDSVVFVGLGLKKTGSGSWTLVDDQIMPVRGLGSHPAISLVGIAERLAQGDQLGLLLYGYHPQYIASYSRDVSIPVVNVAANLKLPLYAVDAERQPMFANDPPFGALTPTPAGGGCSDPDAGPDPACFAQGSAINVVRQLCDYQFLPGVCDHAMFANPDPGYRPDGSYNEAEDGRPLQLMVGAVHEHSGYSDGDPTAIPRDYFNSAKTGHNVPDSGTGDTGVKLDFMFSSEHSDNAAIPITTAAVCIDPTASAFLLGCWHAG